MNTIRWVDVADPSPEQLDTLSKEFNIEPGLIIGCLEAEHLPKFEKLSNGEYLIFRLYDQGCSTHADTTQELTRKIAMFVTPEALLTIHRSPLKETETLKTKWNGKELLKSDLSAIAYDIINGVISSYESPIENSLDQLEMLEMSIFGAQGAQPFDLQEGYLMKRKSFVFKRLMRTTLEVINQSEMFAKAKKQFMKAQLERLLYYSDDLSESTNSLLNLHISLSSQKTNESAQQTNHVVRILTVLSMFLLPLNVITGVYGMNFKGMPELEWEHGYAFSIFLMVTAVVSIYFWFRSKGWLKD